MASFTEIAKHLGVSKASAVSFSKQGCPKDLQGAAEWYSKRELKRAPTKGRSASPKVPSNPPAPPSPEAPQAPPATPTGDSLQDALNSAILVSDRAHQRVIRALDDDKTKDLSPLFSVHSKALESRFKAERTCREEMERRRLLIPLQEATDIFRRGFDFLLKRMKSLPQAKAQQCNPQNPLHAFSILESSINEIVADAQEQYVT